MAKLRTESGFEFETAETAYDNWELLEILTDVDDGKTGQLTKAVKLILGDDGVNALKKRCRSENGVVSQTAMFAEIAGIFAAIKESKDSLKN